MKKTFCLEITGKWACFTRPEFKVERVSYDIITPSAIRGIFSSIYWKPAIQWVPLKIECLNDIKFQNIQRNEVGIVSKNSFYIEDNRQQRNSRILKNVAYRIHAKMNYTPDNIANPKWKQEIRSDESFKKHIEIFYRRASSGQCFNQPYLGCREYQCDFKLIENVDCERKPIDKTYDLGYMLYDIDYNNNSEAMFFRADMIRGSVEIPTSIGELIK